MAKTRGLLLAKMDPPGENEKQWNDYYNRVHVADRLAIPGFLSARRFTKVDGIPKQYAIPGDAKYLAIYDVDTLTRPEERRVPPGLGKGPCPSLRTALKLRYSSCPGSRRGIYEEIFPCSDDYKTPDSKFVLLVGHEIPRGRKNGIRCLVQHRTHPHPAGGPRRSRHPAVPDGRAGVPADNRPRRNPLNLPDHLGRRRQSRF